MARSRSHSFTPLRSISTSQQFGIAVAELKYMLRIADRVMRIGCLPRTHYSDRL